MTRFIEPISPNVTMVRKGFSPACGGFFDFFHNPVATMHPNGAIQIDSHISSDVINRMRETFNEYEQAGHLYPVSVTGLKTGENDPVGSHRFCNMDRVLADAVTRAVNQLGIAQFNVVERDSFINIGECTGTSWDTLDRCSDYFRFMHYDSGGEHFPHYDSDFIFPNDSDRYTGYTVVIYFTDCETGEFAFVNDTRVNHGFTDWDRQATDDEITLRIKPKEGRILLFPHNLCHTVLPFTDVANDRIIARGDLIFRK